MDRESRSAEILHAPGMSEHVTDVIPWCPEAVGVEVRIELTDGHAEPAVDSRSYGRLLRLRSAVSAWVGVRPFSRTCGVIAHAS